MRITIFDYGAGNLHSLAKALVSPGDADQVIVEPDPARASDTDVLVLPGVGAFSPAAARLDAGRATMRAAIDAGLPTIGICLGMQLLFDTSEEGPGRGLGVLPGVVTRLRASRVPQIGWNTLEWTEGSTQNAPLATAYFANSYVCRAAPECVIAWSDYENDRFAAAVRAGNTLGLQFHPEKSSAAGVALLRQFIRTASRA